MAKRRAKTHVHMMTNDPDKFGKFMRDRQAKQQVTSRQSKKDVLTYLKEHGMEEI